MSSTQNRYSSGREFEVTANLTPSWRLSLNFGNSATYSDNAFVDLQQYIKDNEARTRQILSDAGILIDSRNVASINPALNDAAKINQLKVQAAVDQWNILQTAVIPALEARGERTSTTNPAWLGSFASDYRFGSGRLKGLRVGMAVLYRPGALIGNRGADTIVDPNNPTRAIDDPSVDATTNIYDKTRISGRGSLSYGWKVGKDRAWAPRTVQIDLSIDNLFGQLRPLYGNQGAGNASSGATMLVPRSW
jgi:hypothetical protein